MIINKFWLSVGTNKPVTNGVVDRIDCEWTRGHDDKTREQMWE